MTIPDTIVDRPIADTFLVQRFGWWVFGQTSVMVTTTTSPQDNVSWMDSHPGVPNIGAAWSTSDERLVDLRLEEREAQVVNVDGTNYRVKVRLVYRLQKRFGAGGLALYAIPLRGGGSLQQERTSVDINGVPITVDFTDGSGTEFASITAQVDMLRPHLASSREIVLSTDSPDSISASWVGFINNATWEGQPPGAWLCVRADYELVNGDSVPFLYAFIFEFVLASDLEVGWKYKATYVNTDGRVPEGVSVGNGIREVAGHLTRNFSQYF